MARKTFFLILAILIITFGFSYAIRYLKPASASMKELSSFPLQLGQWQGKVGFIDEGTLNMLNPDQYFDGTYTSASGDQVQLFFDYFGKNGSSGGVHSPRNCLPGSGWAILRAEQRQINIQGHAIPASRFYLQLGKNRQVMDFWYVTRQGETSNDYKFKYYTMLSSLTLQPTDVAFIRFVAPDSPAGLNALDDFEKTSVPVIYSFLPY